MAVNLFSLFGGPQRAVDQALRQSGQRQLQGAANAVAAGTARSNVNPMAAARTRNQAMVEERNAMAGREAQMRAQAGLQQQQDISNIIGGGISIAGQALGGLVGGPMGAAAGGALGGMAGDAVKGQMAPAGQAPVQAQSFAQPASGMGRALGAPNQGPLSGQLGALSGIQVPQMQAPQPPSQASLMSQVGIRQPGMPNPAVAQGVNSLSRGQFDPMDILQMLLGRGR